MNNRIGIGMVLAVAAAAPAWGGQFELTPAQAVPVREPFVFAEAGGQAVTGVQVQGVVESRVTTGRPYSAEATTEFVQVLGDGNKIVRKTTVRIFRDGEGRTRREELGPDGTPQSISIYDPVANTTFVLDPATGTAHRGSVRIVYAAQGPSAAPGRDRITLVEPTLVTKIEDQAINVEKAVVVREPKGVVAGARARAAAPGVIVGGMEPLGDQVIEGVPATGTRSTSTIPPGTIGNELQIRTVSEQWVSPELQVLVMTRHSDPRSGETTYRLSNIVPGEPGAGLFTVPADYTIKDGHTFDIKTTIR
jgi:hypothetical protein